MVFTVKAPVLTTERRRGLLSFLSSINISIDKLEILNLALIHSSWANEEKSECDNNERLEFLGDSILGFVTADYLFSTYSSVYHEGGLSKIKSAVVSEASLSEVALSIGLDKVLLLGQGEINTGGNKKKAILADALEAVIAAIYVDSGIEKAKSFVLSFIPNQVSRFLDGEFSHKDYKSILQEYYQKKRGKVPRYELVRQEGPEHEYVFYVVVHLGTKTFGPGDGRSKKEAEQEAARIALTSLNKDRPEVPTFLT